MAEDWGNKLWELFEAIYIIVNVVLVVIVQSYGTPSSVHDDELNDPEATKFLEVNICNLEPA